MGLNRILYVEDDPDIRTVTLLALEMLGGFQVDAYGSGLEALSAAPAATPDLILLDVMMPGLDGPTTLARLRTMPALARVPAVFFTARARPEDVERLLSAGGCAVLPKPFDPERLPGELESIWRAAS